VSLRPPRPGETTQPLPPVGGEPARSPAAPGWIPPTIPYSGPGGYGGGPGGYGGYGGYGAGAWQPPGGASPPPPWRLPPPKQRTGLLVALLAVALLAVAGAGAALSVFVFNPHRTAANPPPAASPAPAPSPSPSPVPSPSPSPLGGAVVPPAASSSPSPALRVPSPAAPAAIGVPLSLSAIVAKVSPGVVDVDSDLGGGSSASGTGMILTAGGEVLTNNHVIAGALSTTVELADTGQRFSARVLNEDLGADVAILQIEGASGLPTIPLGNSSTVRLGDPVVTLGNAQGLNGPPSVSQGVVVALNQSITATDASSGSSENLSGLIQIDAGLQPGDSGGPLVNALGQVIGMDTAASNRVRFSSSAGFAIPIDTALAVASRLASQPGGTTSAGFLGVEVADLSEVAASSPGYVPPVAAGAYVAQVIAGEPAQRAGIVAGDIIVSVNGSPVTSPSTLTALLAQDHAGATVQVGWVDSLGISHTAAITLAAHPPA
jgi:S1-C subfamily serine protease